tara:strand:- start:1254 stop:1511 length:258 start_codon:yes stop_codon:yes gene_type:complete
MGAGGLNRSSYNSKMLRDEEPAAPAPRSRVIGTVNPYWLDQARKRQAASAKRREAYKRQAASKKWKVNKVTMDELLDHLITEIKD